MSDLDGLHRLVARAARWLSSTALDSWLWGTRDFFLFDDNSHLILLVSILSSPFGQSYFSSRDIVIFFLVNNPFEQNVGGCAKKETKSEKKYFFYKPIRMKNTWGEQNLKFPGRIPGRDANAPSTHSPCMSAFLCTLHGLPLPTPPLLLFNELHLLWAAYYTSHSAWKAAKRCCVGRQPRSSGR